MRSNYIWQSKRKNMKYQIKISKNVEKFLKTHPDFFNKFETFCLILEKDPLSAKLDIKPLKWTHQYYRIRSWKYRLLYTIVDQEVLIYFYKAGSRWDIYK